MRFIPLRRVTSGGQILKSSLICILFYHFYFKGNNLMRFIPLRRVTSGGQILKSSLASNRVRYLLLYAAVIRLNV